MLKKKLHKLTESTFCPKSSRYSFQKGKAHKVSISNPLHLYKNTPSQLKTKQKNSLVVSVLTNPFRSPQTRSTTPSSAVTSKFRAGLTTKNDEPKCSWFLKSSCHDMVGWRTRAQRHFATRRQNTALSSMKGTPCGSSGDMRMWRPVRCAFL